MAVTDAYATAALYRSLVNKSSGALDAVILDDLTAVSRYLDRKLGRFFTVDGSVVARTYRPSTSYTKTLFVDDIATLTGLVVKVDDNRDGTAEATLTRGTDFEVRPPNAGLGPEPSPYTQLWIPAIAARHSWCELVEVTAKFGWAAVPKAIERATCHLTGILRLESPRATARIQEGIGTVLDSSIEAQRIVAQLSDVYAKPAWIFA